MRAIGPILLACASILPMAAQARKQSIPPKDRTVPQGEFIPGKGFVPKEGYVPTAEVAIKIAVAVWEPIYGVERIARKKPFRATLNKGVWTVTGSLPEGWEGGVPRAEIAKDDARILHVIHGK